MAEKLSDIIRRLFSQPTARLLGLAVLVGLLAGAAISAYDWLLERLAHGLSAHVLGPSFAQQGLADFAAIGSGRQWLFPLTVALGLLLTVVITQALGERRGGHSTDRVIDAFHNDEGRLSPRTGIVTALGSLLTIGLGGGVGKEGPAGVIGAAIAAAIGRLTKLDAQERRWLLLLGLSAGLSAAFKTPLGAAFIAIEVLYRDMSFESEALLYTIVSAVIAFVLAGSLGGWQSGLYVAVAPPPATMGLIAGVALLGAVAGLVAAVLPTLFFGIQAFVTRWPGHPWLKAILGGVVVGGLALLLPQSVGDALMPFQARQLLTQPLWALLLFAAITWLAMALTLAVGGIGGVLTPTLFVGAALGGAFASLLQLPAAEFSIIGMATIFAAIARAPIGTLLMVSELTRGYELMPEAALGVAISYLMQHVVAEKLNHPAIHGGQPMTLWNSPAHRDQVLTAGLSLLQRGGFSMPAGLQLPDLRALLSLGYPIELGNDDLILLNAQLGEQSPLHGRLLSQNPFGSDVLLLEIRRGASVERPRGDSLLQNGDQIVLIARLGRLPELLDHIETSAVFNNWLARHHPQTHAACLARRSARP